jgi:hypothetical protein
MVWASLQSDVSYFKQLYCFITLEGCKTYLKKKKEKRKEKKKEEVINQATT